MILSNLFLFLTDSRRKYFSRKKCHSSSRRRYFLAEDCSPCKHLSRSQYSRSNPSTWIGWNRNLSVPHQVKCWVEGEVPAIGLNKVLITCPLVSAIVYQICVDCNRRMLWNIILFYDVILLNLVANYERHGEDINLASAWFRTPYCPPHSPVTIPICHPSFSQPN